jgi:hypothetical protein
MNNLRCPLCGLSHIKRNGYTHYGKQNYRCKDCDRQFVEDSQHIGEEVKDLIKVLLLGRLSLRGICRVTGVSLTWLLDFIAEVYAESPDDLNVKSVKRAASFSCCDSKRRPMKCGVSSFPKGTSNGSGLRFMSLRNRSLPFMSVIVRPPAPQNCGDAFRKFIVTTQLSIRMVWSLIR